MYQYIALKKLLNTLTKQQQKSLVLLQILMLFSSLLEIFWIFLIGFFIANISNVGNTEIVWQKYHQLFTYFFSANDNQIDFIITIGLVTIAVLFFSSVFSVITIWLSARFSTHLGMSISNDLYRYYLHKPWLFHTLKNSSHFAKDMLFEVNRMTSVFTQLMEANHKIMMVILMSAALLLANPTITIIILAILIGVYWFIYWPINAILKQSGNQISGHNKTLFRLIFEGFSGIKEILLRRCQHYFKQKLEQTNQHIAHIKSTNTVLIRAPKYLIEFITFSLIILFIIYYSSNQTSSFLVILPMITLYIVSGLRLLPAIQAIYASIASIQNNMPAFEALQQDLNHHKLTNKTSNQTISFNHNIKFCNVSFAYPRTKHLAINAIDLTIKAKQVVGLVGMSGCGKTSIMDLITGLIRPDSGNILIDNKPLTANNIHAWQDLLSYVCQTIFLLDDSVKHNIAFGIDAQDIDEQRIKQVLTWAHLDKVVANLAQGVDTNIGQHGVKLSGGQRQRIGIARALYQNTSVILLDEATSALDALSEQFISDSMTNFDTQKTIIIATHRLKTLQKCDIIYLIDEGKIIDQGNYQHLLTNNVFKMMSK